MIINLPLGNVFDALMNRAFGSVERRVNDAAELRAARRDLQAPDHRVACSLRSVGDHRDGLGARWQRGDAVLTPGMLAFMPAAGGFDVIRLRVDAVLDRVPFANERVVALQRLATDRGPVEWWVRPELMDDALELVRPREDV